VSKLFEEYVGKRVCAVYKEGDDVKTTLGVVDKSSLPKFLKIITDDNTEFLINPDTLIKLKIKAEVGD
jgi:hypothetical protein